MNLEDDLRRALRREPAPADFAARILSKTTRAGTRVLPFRRRPVTLAIAAALALAALIPPAVYQHRRQQRALEARDQLVAALAITRVQLEHVKERIRQNTRHKMRTAWILFAAAIPAAVIPALAQQNFDFKSLDKLGANASGSTNITLEGDTLKLATSFLGGDSGPFRNLTGVYVRSFEFAKTGQYNDADLAPLRAYLKSLQWSKIVDTKDADETSQIYLQPLPGNKLGGLAIVSAEAKEVTVVFISGVLNMSDLGKLSGNLGIPDIQLNNDGKKSDNSKKD